MTESKSGNCDICGKLDKLFNTLCLDGIWRWLCPWCINENRRD